MVADGRAAGGARVESRGLRRGAPHGVGSGWGPLLLALPLLVYLVPLALGYAWSSLDPNTPNVPGLEGYQGRSPDQPVSVDALRSGGLVVPRQALLRAFLQEGELPLWNPYQGLGQPFAAQPHGSTYSPLAIVRALLPYRFADHVTVVAIYLAGLGVYGLVLGLGASKTAALAGGMAYELSGALSFNLARPELVDQLAMLAVLFWAAERALRRRRVNEYTLLAAVSALSLVAGVIEIALLGGLVLIAFMLVHVAGSAGARLRQLSLGLGALLLGGCLAAFHLVPLVEAVRHGANVGGDLAGFAPIPSGNAVAFVAPTTFGPLDPRGPTWVPAGPASVLDWSNLDACLGMGIAALVTLGWVVQGPTWGPRQRLGFRFFAVAGAFMLLRYLQVQPFAAMNLLPLPDLQTPQYAPGVAAFCLIVAAALAIDHVRAEPLRRVRWWTLGVAAVLAASVLTLVGQQGGFGSVNADLASAYVRATLAVASLTLLGLALARRWAAVCPGVLVNAVVLGELSTYVPLGNRAPELLWARIGLFGALVVAGLLLASGWQWPGIGLIGMVVVGYAALIALPSVGLPRQFDADRPPAFMRWLKAATGDEYRSFGISPNFSAFGGVQDVSVAGPLAPQEFGAWIQSASPAQVVDQYQRSGTFWLSSRFSSQTAYPLTDYATHRPWLDWVGVRFLVLERAVFQPAGRTDDQTLLASNPGVQVAYEDAAVRIVESQQARPKAEFWSGADIYPDQAAVLARLRQSPQSVLGRPMLEDTGEPLIAQLQAQSSGAEPGPVRVDEYRPGEVRLGVQSPSAGLIVLKDVYSPGWHARVDGQPTQVLRVNGLVRGVAIAEAGPHEVVFEYQPESFVRGVWLAVLTAVLLLASVAAAHSGQWRRGQGDALEQELCSARPA
jgi:Bacterial membrane protein YfhO